MGEHFRVFVSYGVIAFSLALYAWRNRREKENERKRLMELNKASSLESAQTGGVKA